MMRSWENRADTDVIDEPFYAHYLHSTGIDHPMRDAIIAAGVVDLKTIIARLRTPPARGIFYQKHITTHWLPYFPSGWLADIQHVFLIREPVPVIASYRAKREAPTIDDLGYPQQAMLFALIAELQGRAPLVIDSRRFLNNPEAQLRQLCARLDIDFDPAMLAWPAGERNSDGIWARHWYDAVKGSTGFAAPPNTVDLEQLDGDLADLAQRCAPYYERMYRLALD